MPNLSNLFTCLFKKGTSQEKAQPPPYTTQREAESGPIKAFETPQWKWSNAECKEWLLSYLIDKLQYDRAKAESLVAKLKGDGTVMYCRDYEEWRILLGKWQAKGVYIILFALRREEGAVPQGTDLRHWAVK